MFFNTHSEGKIGFKKLTDADLGRGQSHQTHIGLYDDILTFLQDREVEEEAMFIFNNESCMLDCYFDRIENPDGSFRSPKIKKGGRDAVSVVTVIRDYAQNSPSHYNWYLIWFGLESEKIVFFCFNDQMPAYEEVSTFIDVDTGGRISYGDRGFESLVTYLENMINNSGTAIMQELEIASQIGSKGRFKRFDLEKANKLFKETGRLGEELVAEYLDEKLHAGRITNYIWENKNQESGAPFDFKVQENNQNIIHIDVKSTQYKFEQQMFFSGNEVEFINNIPNYHIFRVYNLSSQDRHYLRICENSKLYVPDLVHCISEFNSKIKELKADLHSVNLAISPNIEDLIFKPEILLS